MGVSRNAIKRYLRGARPGVGKPRGTPGAPVRDAVEPRVLEILEDSKRWTAAKQRLTTARLRELLRGEGHDVGYTVVRRSFTSGSAHARRCSFRSSTSRATAARTMTGEEALRLAGPLEPASFAGRGGARARDRNKERRLVDEGKLTRAESRSVKRSATDSADSTAPVSSGSPDNLVSPAATTTGRSRRSYARSRARTRSHLAARRTGARTARDGPRRPLFPVPPAAPAFGTPRR